MKTNKIKWNESMNYICSNSPNRSNRKNVEHIVSNITKKTQNMDSEYVNEEEFQYSNHKEQAKKSGQEVKEEISTEIEKEFEKQKETELKTIIANVIYGSGSQKCQTTIFFSIKKEVEPTKVLGCFITNEKIHKNTLLGYSGNKINVKFDGELEIHIWYTKDGSSDILKKNIQFSEVISLEKYEDSKDINHKSISSWINKIPSSLKTMIINKSDFPKISIQIEYELGVKVIGESSINVRSYKTEDTDQSI